MTRTAHDNAHEFGALTKQGYGVRLAVLVACSVDTTGKGGRPSETGRALQVSKVAAKAFAREANVSMPTVLGYLNKWDRMVSAGWDVDRAGLTPDMADTLEVTDEFVDAFDRLATAGKSGLVGKAADIAKNLNAMAEAIKADPDVAARARQALDERYAKPALTGDDMPGDREVRDHSDAPTEFLVRLRRIQRETSELVRLTAEGKVVIADGQRDGLVAIVALLLRQFEAIESGLTGDSLDKVLADLLAES